MNLNQANKPPMLREVMVEGLERLFAGEVKNPGNGICWNLADSLCDYYNMSWDHAQHDNLQASAYNLVAYGCVGFIDLVGGEMIDEPTNSPIAWAARFEPLWTGQQGKSRKALIQHLLARLHEGFQPEVGMDLNTRLKVTPINREGEK